MPASLAHFVLHCVRHSFVKACARACTVCNHECEPPTPPKRSVCNGWRAVFANKKHRQCKKNIDESFTYVTCAQPATRRHCARYQNQSKQGDTENYAVIVVAHAANSVMQFLMAGMSGSPAAARALPRSSFTEADKPPAADAPCKNTARIPRA